MNSEEYKQICSQPNVLSHADLERTKKILVLNNAPELAVIERALSHGFIGFPEKYNQNSTAASRNYRVSCMSEEANNIAELLHDAEVHSLTPSGVASQESNFYGALGDMWDELADFI